MIKNIRINPEIFLIALGLIFAGMVIIFNAIYTPPVTVIPIVYETQSSSALATSDFSSQSNTPAVKSNPAKTQNEDLPENTQSITTGKTNNNGLININTASLAQLKNLKGVGDVIGERIIAYRNENGGFKSIEDIKNVKGIGEATFEKIRPFITVE